MFKFISKVFIITIITLFSLILIKSNKKVKRLVYNYVYSENISFSKIYSLYFILQYFEQSEKYY